MNEKQRKPDWYVAATHYLTAVFAPSFLVNLVFGLAIAPLIKDWPEAIILVILNSLIILVIWLGVMYSAKYLSKTYVIENKDNIINSATMYFVVLNSGFVLVRFFAEMINELGLLFGLTWAIIGAVLFHLFSKKYVREDDESTVSPNQF
jgi:hypothetical protein